MIDTSVVIDAADPVPETLPADAATDLLILATAAASGRALLTLDRAQAGLAEAPGVVVWTVR